MLEPANYIRQLSITLSKLASVLVMLGVSDTNFETWSSEISFVLHKDYLLVLNIYLVGSLGPFFLLFVYGDSFKRAILDTFF